MDTKVHGSFFYGLNLFPLDSHSNAQDFTLCLHKAVDCTTVFI